MCPSWLLLASCNKQGKILPKEFSVGSTFYSCTFYKEINSDRSFCDYQHDLIYWPLCPELSLWETQCLFHSIDCFYWLRLFVANSLKIFIKGLQQRYIRRMSLFDQLVQYVANRIWLLYNFQVVLYLTTRVSKRHDLCGSTIFPLLSFPFRWVLYVFLKKKECEFIK